MGLVTRLVAVLREPKPNKPQRFPLPARLRRVLKALGLTKRVLRAVMGKHEHVLTTEQLIDGQALRIDAGRALSRRERRPARARS